MECQANLRESFREHSWTFVIYVERSRHAVKHCMERFSANFMVHIAEAQNGVRETAENAADRAKGHRGTVRRQAVLYVALYFYFLRAPKPERRSGHLTMARVVYKFRVTINTGPAHKKPELGPGLTF